MRPVIRPPVLRPGDTVAVVSLSAGVAAALPHRFEAGRRQLAATFDLDAVDAPHARRDDGWLHDRPEARAEDLHWALEHPDVRAIVTAIGGEDTIRTLPFVDLARVSAHPKVLLGFSDTTVQHLMWRRAGVVSFYGPSLLTGLAENGGIHRYTVDAVRRALFTPEPFALDAAPEWTEEFLDWHRPELQQRRRRWWPNPGWAWLQGDAAVEGELVGGCMEVLEIAKGTTLWPAPEDFDGALLHLELSEEAPPPATVTHWLRNYAATGILSRLGALLLSRPLSYPLADAFRLWDAVLGVLAEAGRTDLPVVANLDFGHSSPMGVLPLGVRARVDPATRTITTLEPAVSPR